MSPVKRRDEAGRRPGDARSAVRGAFALAASQVAGRALSLAFVLVATRVLTPSDFGRYAVASALFLAAATVADLGTTSAITKLVSREPEGSDAVLSAAVIPSAVLGLLSLVALVVFVFIGGYPAAMRTDILLAGFGLPAEAVTTSLFGGFDGRGLIARRAKLTLVRVVTMAGGGLVAVLVTGNVRPAIAALGAGPVVTLIIAVAGARRHGVWRGHLLFDRKAVASLLRQATPFAALGAINVVVLRADVVILSLMASPAEVARYDVALRATEALTFLATVVAAPSLFILSRRLGDGDTTGAQRAYDRAIWCAYLIGLPVSAALVALPEELADLLFGPKYRASGGLLRILGLQVWLAFVASIQGSLLLAGGQLRRAVKLFAALAVLAVGLEVAAIALGGATGAAIAMVILQSGIVVTAARFSAVAARVILPLPPLAMVAAAVLSGAAMASLASAGLASSLGAGALTYALVLVITRAVRKSDLDDILGYLRRSPPSG